MLFLMLFLIPLLLFVIIIRNWKVNGANSLWGRSGDGILNNGYGESYT